MDEGTPVRALRLVEELCERGFTVKADRRQNRVYVGPSERLTDDLRRRIRQQKPALLSVLDPAPPDRPCPGCGSANYVRRHPGRWRCLECWDLTADEAASYFFGPLNWMREEMPA